jgi:hypothetical protein
MDTNGPSRHLPPNNRLSGKILVAQRRFLFPLFSSTPGNSEWAQRPNDQKTQRDPPLCGNLLLAFRLQAQSTYGLLFLRGTSCNPPGSKPRKKKPSYLSRGQGGVYGVAEQTRWSYLAPYYSVGTERME